jgi:hypothetical protein
MMPNTLTLTDAITAIADAKPGRQRQVRVKRAIRAAVDLDVERHRLVDKLEKQWDWLCRNSETDPEYRKRESLFYRTLAQYEAACDALTAAGKVLLV